MKRWIMAANSLSGLCLGLGVALTGSHHVLVAIPVFAAAVALAVPWYAAMIRAHHTTGNGHPNDGK